MRSGLVALVGLVALAGCAAPARMCAQGADCGSASSCVAGRCVARGAVVSIATARRLVFDPIDVGYVRRGGPPAWPQPGAARPPVAVLGGREGGLALLRFAVRLPPEAHVVEAYLLLDRAPGVAPDPDPVALHLAPIVGAWDGQSLTWALQPRVEEVGSPVTRVLPAAAGPVRLDVRAIVERWRTSGAASDGGVAVVAAPAAGDAAAGVALALGPLSGLSGGDASYGPRLELYVQ